MLSSYGRILRVPGGLRFSLAGLFGRLPISMMGLGIVLLVQRATGSYGLAGSVSAAYVVANAGFSLLQGRLLDRHGQAGVLVPAALVFTGATGLLVGSVLAGWPTWSSWLLAAVAGAGLPTAGICVRARWSWVLRGRPQDLQTAFALEAVADETVFILGPILVTVLATTLHPVAGLATAVASGLAGSLALAAQRGTEPPTASRAAPRRDRPRLPWRVLVPLVAVQVALGCLFGAAEVVTVAFADEQGSQAYAGPLLALYALGSLMAGLVSGAIAWRRGPDVRVRAGAAAMCAAVAPLPFIDSVPLMGAALLLGGFSIAPTLIGSVSLTEQSVPPVRLTEGMAVVHTGLVAGVAPGAMLAGIVVDRSGSGAAFLVLVAAGAVAALAAQLLPRSTVQRQPATA